METFNPQKNQEERFAQIKSEIEHMKANRVSKEEFEEVLARSKVLAEKGVNRTEEENIEKDALKTKFENLGVFVKTLPEFRYAVGCLGYYSEKKVEGLVSHENAHANKIESLGVEHVGYGIISFIDKNGKEEEYFFAKRGEFPEEWTREEELVALKQMAQAPEEYESNQPLSDGDKDQIKKANDELLK